MARWLSGHHPSEVSSSEGPSRVPDAENVYRHVADIKGKGDQDLFDLTGRRGLGYGALIHVGYDQFQEVCPTTRLSRTTSVVDLIFLTIHSVFG